MRSEIGGAGSEPLDGERPHSPDATCQKLALLLTTSGSTPLPGVLRLAQKPMLLLVAPGAITRFQLRGVTLTTPLAPENAAFQLV